MLGIAASVSNLFARPIQFFLSLMAINGCHMLPIQNEDWFQVPPDLSSKKKNEKEKEITCFQLYKCVIIL